MQRVLLDEGDVNKLVHSGKKTRQLEGMAYKGMRQSGVGRKGSVRLRRAAGTLDGQ